MHRWFAERMQAELERHLRDPYDDICQMLRAGTPFSFSRFGDGELNAIFGMEGVNVDGYRYFSDLSARLRRIVEGGAGYLMGLQAHAIMVHGVRSIRALSPQTKWVLADSIHSASMEGRLGRFFAALDDRDVVLLGGPHHRPLAIDRSWQLVEIADGDPWLQYESLRSVLEARAGGHAGGVVFLLCASMTANVLIDDLHRLNPLNTHIDLGSVLDPYVGVTSRAYHEEMDPDPLKGIRAGS